MTKSELERHLRKYGCTLAREGGRHSIWVNPANGASAAVPRHRELKKNTARRICQDLGVEKPNEL